MLSTRPVSDGKTTERIGGRAMAGCTAPLLLPRRHPDPSLRNRSKTRASRAGQTREAEGEAKLFSSLLWVRSSSIINRRLTNQRQNIFLDLEADCRSRGLTTFIISQQKKFALRTWRRNRRWWGRLPPPRGARAGEWPRERGGRRRRLDGGGGGEHATAEQEECAMRKTVGDRQVDRRTVMGSYGWQSEASWPSVWERRAMSLSVH
jgi:hypothetical protein